MFRFCVARTILALVNSTATKKYERTEDDFTHHFFFIYFFTGTE
jgi:hypothetical protein